MKFSVVIPLYNKAPHIKRTVESVLNQTCGDFELIVVDDGSTDGGGQIVEGVHDPRIYLITQENKGVSAARNTGIKTARAEFVAFLDADDEWKTGFLQEINRLIEKFPASGAYATSYENINPGGRMTYPKIRGLQAGRSGIIERPFQVFQSGLPFNSSSIVIPKRVLEELGGFQEGVNLGEDVLMWDRITVKYPISFSASSLAVYHKEAVNRASREIVISDSPTQSMRLILSSLETMELDPLTRKDLEDYYAYKVIIRAREAMLMGSLAVANNWLKTLRWSGKFGFQRGLLLLACNAPVKWIFPIYRWYKNRNTISNNIIP